MDNLESQRKGEYLFVYGTLLKELNHPMHRILKEKARLIGRAEMVARLYEVGGYPGVVPALDEQDSVKGEVYLLIEPEEVFKVLDRYEGCNEEDEHPTEYVRVKVPVSIHDGEQLTAWVYMYNYPVEGLKRIRSGDYLKYVRGEEEV